MIRLPKKRTWATVGALILMTALGAFAGYMSGRATTRRITESTLANEAFQIEGNVDSFVNEAFSLLKSLNSSNYPFCSDAQIAHFRSLIFYSVTFRDAGKMRNGKMECSALFARENLPQESFQPTTVRQDGSKVYLNLPPYRSGLTPVFTIQAGDSFVVQDPSFLSTWRALSPKFEQSNYDAASHQWTRPSGMQSNVPGAIRDRDARGTVGDMVYATSCSPRILVCTTVYSSFSAALWAEKGQIVVDSALGGLIGILLVLAYILIHLRSKSMTQQLRRAIRRDRLQVVYQPIVELATGRIVEAEALARWTDEDGIAIPPDVFVRLAEEEGFIGELTALVVRHALRDFGPLLRQKPDFLLSINVEAADLADESFLPMLEQSLAAAHVPPESFGIEVTEGSMINEGKASETIRRLRERGHRLKIDDFGTGYSSLAYLKDLAVDVIKIDKAFTQAIGTDSVVGEILPPILTLAKSLDLQVVVEGIETLEQSSYFAGLQRPVRGQGWLFGHPVTAHEFHANLSASDKQHEETAIQI